LSNLIDLLSVHSKPLYLITGNKGFNYFRDDPRIVTLGTDHDGATNIFLRILKYTLLQIRISHLLLKINNKCDVFIFFLGGEDLVFPMIIAKIFKKKVVILFAGSSVHTLYYDNLVLGLKILTGINCTLCYKIVLFSERLIKEWNLERYQNKILIAQNHIVDLPNFRVETPLSARPPHIGYFGRLSKEKGIINFIQSLPILLQRLPELQVIIGGNGAQYQYLMTYINENNLTDHVKIIGWVPHEDLPKYLNGLRLVVIPSYTEGLPNIMLEAMACGTPVLATPVGAIPDVIQDGITGFIMTDNSPECIAENITRAIQSANLGNVGKNGEFFVHNNYSLEEVTKKWKQVVNDIRY